MLYMLGVNTSITAIYERVLYGYFIYPKNWCSIHQKQKIKVFDYVDESVVPRCPTTAPVNKQLVLAALSWTHSYVGHSIPLRYGFVAQRMNKTSINPSVMTDNSLLNME